METMKYVVEGFSNIGNTYVKYHNKFNTFREAECKYYELIGRGHKSVSINDLDTPLRDFDVIDAKKGDLVVTFSGVVGEIVTDPVPIELDKFCAILVKFNCLPTPLQYTIEGLVCRQRLVGCYTHPSDIMKIFKKGE